MNVIKVSMAFLPPHTKSETFSLKQFYTRGNEVFDCVFECSNFKSAIWIGPVKISADNYNAVDDSALCVIKRLAL